MRVLLLIVSLAAVGAAQNIQRTVHLTSPVSTQASQEMMTILLTVADLKDTNADARAQTISFGGTAGQVALSEWIIGVLDQPPSQDAGQKQIRDSATWQYTVPGTPDDFVRAFYLKNISNPQGMQELLTNLRTVADVQKIFNYTPLMAIVLRGPAEQVKLAAWMIDLLDQPGQPAENPAAFHYTSPLHKEELVRVFYLPRISQSKQLQDVLTAVRTKAKVEKAFYCSHPAALVLRGTADQMIASETLIGQSDLAAR
ncbi:MAG: hypothetical protein ABJC09_03725 [Terriglobia bacterium]